MINQHAVAIAVRLCFMESTVKIEVQLLSLLQLTHNCYIKIMSIAIGKILRKKKHN